MYDHVLIPTDGSDPSEVAVDHAVEVAATHGATLHALFVMDAGVELASTDVGPARERVEEALQEEGRRAVSSVEERAEAAGIDCETVIEEGDPQEEIVDYVDDHDVDLVVMGTHGRTGIERVLLGSTTERVLRQSDVPVLTVSGGEE